MYVHTIRIYVYHDVCMYVCRICRPLLYCLKSLLENFKSIKQCLPLTLRCVILFFGFVINLFCYLILDNWFVGSLDHWNVFIILYYCNRNRNRINSSFVISAKHNIPLTIYISSIINYWIIYIFDFINIYTIQSSQTSRNNQDHRTVNWGHQ